MAGDLSIGVLALQGGFSKHMEKLESCFVNPKPIRYQEELLECDGLIIPGGESTAISHLLRTSGLLESLMHYKKPIFGTCAGLILLSKWGHLDVAVQRNAYGRQISSFQAEMEFENAFAEGLFIRAPKIVALLSDEVKVLARHQGEPVLVRQGINMGATFHPELCEGSLIHDYFIGVCHEAKRQNCSGICS